MSMPIAAVDFETTYDKTCSIKPLGWDAYFRHPHFECYLVAIKTSDGFGWVGHPAECPWERIKDHHWISHNAMFDENAEGLFDNVDLQEFESNGQPDNGVGASPDGIGASPDGLGEYDDTPEDMANPMAGPSQDFSVPHGNNAYEPGYSGSYQQQAMAGWEPEDTSPEAATKSAGFTLLFVALSTGVGYAAKGGMGAATGLLASGAVANGYRAQKWWGEADLR